ncbi:protein-glutamate O-methyltransferase CheR [Chitinivorax sp. B]|uniref:CheR family methyltransferase n=1 Tax=Chitinivorax sp. B TaxID=2502235 RepID=UPI001485162B|nr:protein-glutamate O-methyltransferase CheR [Chitinivorax sp. B]
MKPDCVDWLVDIEMNNLAREPLPASQGQTSQDRLTQFAAWVAEHLGLSYAPMRLADLDRVMKQVAVTMGYADSAMCMQSLMDSAPSNARLTLLASQLTVGETYFFREPAVLDALKEYVLPALIAERQASGQRHLRLWSAACSTGEEPYSLAILLTRLLPVQAGWRIRLLATDINPQSLQQARLARYSRWSFRNPPDWLIPGYFTPDGNRHLRLVDSIRDRVEFAWLNLVQPELPVGLATLGMDIVLCRNALMYFTQAQAKRVVDRFYQALNPGGWLIVGAVEANPTWFVNFERVRLGEVWLYRKPSAERTVSTHQAEFPPLDLPSIRPSPSADVLVPPLPPVAVLAPRQPISQQVPTLLNEARQMADAGNLIAAEACCHQAIAIDKLNPASQYLLAMVLNGQGRNAAALHALRAALFLDEKLIVAHVALSAMYRYVNEAASQRHLTQALHLLKQCEPTELVPEAAGVTASQLLAMIGGHT